MTTKPTKPARRRARARRPPPQAAQRGSMLVEALIAIVLLSVAMLGIAGRQLATMRDSGNTYAQTVADAQARQILERMRRNPVGVAGGSYNAVTAGAGSNPGCIGSAGGCSPTAVAATDIALWQADNARLLPAGSGTVTGSGANSVFTVTVSWSENSGGSGTARSWSVSARP